MFGYGHPPNRPWGGPRFDEGYGYGGPPRPRGPPPPHFHQQGPPQFPPHGRPPFANNRPPFNENRPPFRPPMPPHRAPWQERAPRPLFLGDNRTPMGAPRGGGNGRPNPPIGVRGVGVSVLLALLHLMGVQGSYRVQVFNGAVEDAELYDVRPPFDVTTVAPLFPNSHEVDDTKFVEALATRDELLKPTAVEEMAMNEMVADVNAAIDKLIVAPELFDAARVGEMRPVGSLRAGTLITKHMTADLLLVLHSPPTVEAVDVLSQHVIENLKTKHTSVTSTPQETGFALAIPKPPVTVRVLVATTPEHMSNLDEDLHYSAEVIERNLRTLAHSRWSEEFATHPTVKMLVRLLKDVRHRYPGLHVLNSWMLQLLAHHAVTCTPSNKPLAIAPAFRRAFSLLSSGLFLRGSTGLTDPCSRGPPIHDLIALPEQDVMCATAQTLLRCISHGGYLQVLGLKGDNQLCAASSVWEGVVVSPLDAAYESKDIPDQEAECDLDDAPL